MGGFVFWVDVDLAKQAVAWTVFCLICAFACYQIMKSKGYPDYACGRGLGWAYLLNIIWVIVTLCRPHVKMAESAPEEYDMPLWECVGLFLVGFALIALALALVLWGSNQLRTGTDSGQALLDMGAAVLFFAFAPLMALFGRI